MRACVLLGREEWLLSHPEQAVAPQNNHILLQVPGRHLLKPEGLQASPQLDLPVVLDLPQALPRIQNTVPKSAGSSVSTSSGAGNTRICTGKAVW